MCVGVVAWQADPRWRLVAAANRDEFHDRPTVPLALWPGLEGIIAGRDLTAGGTWLGVSTNGRFAFVTNHRIDDVAPMPRGSRGALVTAWLTGQGPDSPETLNPFNFIMIDDRNSASFLTNVPQGRQHHLPPGIHGLSNGPFEEPWPKTIRLDSALQGLLASDKGDPASLFDALRDETTPDGQPVAGPGPAFPAIYVRSPTYGTRSSTVVAIAADGAGWIEERRFDADGQQQGHTRCDFRWPA